MKNYDFVESFQFASPKYIEDPINSFRILNEKEVDELVILDIFATPEKRKPNFELLKDIAAEVCMPLSYCGGIKNRFHGKHKAVLMTYSDSTSLEYLFSNFN